MHAHLVMNQSKMKKIYCCLLENCYHDYSQRNTQTDRRRRKKNYTKQAQEKNQKKKFERGFL